MSMRKVFSEVYAVLQVLGEEYRVSVPLDIYSNIENGRDKGYVPAIDGAAPLNKQGLTKECVALIFALKRDYWCKTQEEKDALLAKLRENDGKIQEMLEKALSTRDLLCRLKASK